MIFSLVALIGLKKMLHICRGYVTQVSELWPVGLLYLVAMATLEFQKIIFLNDSFSKTTVSSVANFITACVGSH